MRYSVTTPRAGVVVAEGVEDVGGTGRDVWEGTLVLGLLLHPEDITGAGVGCEGVGECGEVEGASSSMRGSAMCAACGCAVRAHWRS